METPLNWLRLKNFLKLNIQLKQALIVTFFIGVSLLFLADKLESNHLPFGEILHEIGVLCVTITPILFIYELALRRLFINEMSKEMTEVLNGSFKNDVFKIIEKSMPLSYDNILKHGISDAYEDLDPAHLKRRIEESSNTEIRMIKIWIPYLDEVFKPDLLIDSVIRRGCSYKIVLCDPDCRDIIVSRSKTLKIEPEHYAQKIKSTLKYLENIWRRLDEQGVSDKLQVAVHGDFIAGSLIGFKDYYIFGFYLHSRLATQGMQIKIEKGIHTNGASSFYSQLDNHFHEQWDIAHKLVKFDIVKDYELVVR